MTHSEDVLSRRSFFLGRVPNKPEAQEGWYSLEGTGAHSNDVFWTCWADEAGLFIAGDDGVFLQFDGKDWNRLPSPAPVPIHAIWGTDRSDLWAVGWMGLILHHNGDTWEKIRGCVVDDNGKYSSAAENIPFFDINGFPDGRCWVVGDRGTILHFDGTEWVTEDSGTMMHLRAVTTLPDGRVMAAGNDGTVTLRGIDGTWAVQKSSVSSNYTTALTLDNGTVLLAGGRYLIGSNGFRGDLVSWNGETFEKLAPDNEFSRFRSLIVTQKGVLTIGDGGQIHLIGEDKIERLNTGTTHDLLGAITLPSGDALALGDFGTILVGGSEALSCFAPAIVEGTSQANWEAEPTPTDRQLWGIWQDPKSDELYACGEEGTVIVRDRGKWEALPPAGDLGIHDLNRAPDGGLLAAGQLGEIHHFDGTTWRKHFDLFMDITLLAIWSDGAGQIFAAGDEGLVLKWTGADWERMPSGTKSALYGLWGIDAEHLLAVGDFGLVMRWNGTRWDEFNAGTEHFLFDVWGRALDDIFIVGLSGTIGHFDGTRWIITPARARNDLLAVTGTAQDVVAVGAAGAAARYDGTRWHMDETGSLVGLRAVTVNQTGQYFASGDGGTVLKRIVE
ncbi:MAG: WD40/YVTN/BNR-like repeat-containing protein [Thalassovita sp.]